MSESKKTAPHGRDIAALSDGWVKAKGELAAAEDALSYQHQRILELQMLAWKWMQAHDCLKTGRAYELPSPADLPSSIANIDRIEKIVEAYVGGEYEAQGCAAEHILDDIRALRQEPCEYCGPGMRTGLPGNACENCMNTGLKYPDCRTCNGTGKEGRHSICRDCDELPLSPPTREEGVRGND